MKEFHLIINVNNLDSNKLLAFCNEVKRLEIAKEINGVFYCEDDKAKDFNDLFHKIALEDSKPIMQQED